MKDKISDLFDNFNERLKSPFFFSFILSWIFTNWKIPFIMFFYTNEECFYYHGYNKIDYIRQQLDVCNVLVEPLEWSLLLTFLYIIFFKILYRWVEGQTLLQGNKLFKKGAKSATIPIEEFFQRQNEYDEKIEDLSKLLNRQKDKDDTIHSLQKRIIDEENKNVQLNEIINQLNEDRTKFFEERNATNLIAGKWEIELTGNLTEDFERVRGNDIIISYWDFKIADNKDGIFFAQITFQKLDTEKRYIELVIEVQGNLESRPYVIRMNYSKDLKTISGSINQLKMEFDLKLIKRLK